MPAPQSGRCLLDIGRLRPGRSRKGRQPAPEQRQRIKLLLLACKPGRYGCSSGCCRLFNILSMSSCRVPTLEGEKRVRVREGTQTGDRLRLRGLGFPRLGGYQKGDQYAIVRCALLVPPQPSALASSVSTLRDADQHMQCPATRGVGSHSGGHASEGKRRCRQSRVSQRWTCSAFASDL